MLLSFYVDGCLLFSIYKGKIDEVYASLQEDLKIEDDGDLNKYPGIDLDRCPDVSIHISQTYLTQMIPSMIPVMDKSSDKPTPEVKPPLEKNKGSQARKIYLITGQ